ncbi:tRNA pseudouridine(13) synthase TruD [Pseudoalteromonas fenneropenaei]|uniref:tRNA pseudouridine synthase D n=1 Tax=Pseudoalteromonas fenneropenaei TaxID=1737459 RepID=A0ABV7CNR7_9GAMM
MELAYLYGQPSATAEFKTQVEDFMVDELMDIEFSGEGEHVCLQIVKRGENTLTIAKAIAKLAGVQLRDVSYAGLKDRHGVCTQWFSVPVAIKKHIDFSALNNDHCFVLQQLRHNRKLRTGCHRGNRFKITLRKVSDIRAVLSRVNAVRQGVPNYFGEQRFGFNGHNLTMAERMFDGEPIRDKKLRGLVISAARSALFNFVVSERVKAHGLAVSWPREIFLLEGSNAFFEEDLNDSNVARLLAGDIHLSAPLYGKGDKGIVAQEQQWLSCYQKWCEGLCQLGLKMERRALRLLPRDFAVKTLDEHSLELSFSLPKGTFATAVLRELVQYQDVSKGSTEENE